MRSLRLSGWLAKSTGALLVGVLAAIPLRAQTAQAAAMTVAVSLSSSTLALVTATNTDAWGTILSPLSASQTFSLDDGSASGFGSGSATWFSAASGLVQFRNFGWNFVTPPVATTVGLNSVGNWIYTFTATSNAMFSLSGSQSTTGDPFGLQGFMPTIFGGPEGGRSGSCTNAFAPPGACTFDASVTDGFQYSVALQSGANVNTAGSLSGAMDADFTWNITSTVPEPASMTLLATGLVGIVGAGRRRRKKA